MVCCRRYVYDGELEQQMYMLFDANKKLLGTGDIYPSAVQLSKGEYTLRLLLRHDSATLLDKFRALPLVRMPAHLHGAYLWFYRRRRNSTGCVSSISAARVFICLAGLFWTVTALASSCILRIGE